MLANLRVSCRCADCFSFMLTFPDEFVSMIRRSDDGLVANVVQPLGILRRVGYHGSWLAIALVGCAIPLVRAQENNLLLADTANFLDAGLTALGLITALVTTVLRRRLDAETNARDWLVLWRGESSAYRGVQMLTNYNEYYLSQALVLVEESSKDWAQQTLAYYSAATGKRVDVMPVAWLMCADDRAAPKCSCGVSCKCLRFERVDGVCKHLTTVAPGSVFRVDDTYDAIVCASCFHHLCHGSQDRFYQDAGAGRQGPLGRKCSTLSPSRDALLRSAAHVFTAPGRTGLMLLEPANVNDDDCVTWASTISEASTVWDSEERGNENPFSEFYRKALAGERSPGINETDFDPSLWWLSRACAFLLACALVVLFRTDAFSSALLTRRAMRGYIVDSTQTKLPLSTFCSSAKCEVASPPAHFIVVTLAAARPLPKQRLLVGCALEALLVVLWIAILAITPWFQLVGSSYLSDIPVWAAALACAVAVGASSVNVYYYVWRIGATNELKRKWAVLSAACGSIDAAVLALAALLWARVVGGHWVSTSMRALMMVAAVAQWVLGVHYLPTATNSHRSGSGWVLVVPYALTFLRLLALVAGGGKWA